MTPRSKQFVACGMYAFNIELQHAWQALFTRFRRLLDDGDQLAENLVFDTGESVLRDPELFIGHSCGYPLVKYLQDAVSPFCVPVFDVSGVEDNLYSSRFIVAAKSDIGSLAECSGRIVAINNRDSNSGMNVLRHAIAKLILLDLSLLRLLTAEDIYRVLPRLLKIVPTSPLSTVSVFN